MNEIINESPRIRLVFLLWQRYKKHCDSCWPNLETYTAMLDAFSRNHVKDYSDGRFFDHLLMNQDSSVMWNGDKLKDILHWEVIDVIKKRLAKP